MYLSANTAWNLVTGPLWPYIDKNPRLYYAYQHAKSLDQKSKYLSEILDFENSNQQLIPPKWIKDLLKGAGFMGHEIQTSEIDWFPNGKPHIIQGKINNTIVFEMEAYPRRGVQKYVITYFDVFQFMPKKSYYHVSRDEVLNEIKSGIIQLITELKKYN